MDYSKKIPQYVGTDIILTKKQNRQLKKLVKYVKKKSSAMAKLYQGIGDDFTLRDLPVTNKEMLMRDYESWITTKDFTLKDLEEYVSHPELAGELYQGKYSICSTSGTTGYPLYMVYNRWEFTNLVVSMNGNMADKFVLHRPTCSLFPFDKHILTICAAKFIHKMYPLIRRYFIIKDNNVPMDEMVASLNKCQPKIIASYVSTAEALAREQSKGNLHLNLKEVMIGGELLTAKARQLIQDAFGCTVRSLYATTEAGGIAVDCECGHMHLHNKRLILEPVDENNCPVPAGKKAHKMLLTSLYERTVPLIRYEISDKVTIHNDSCPCGNKAPWIEVEGRNTEVPLIFKNKNGEVSVSTFVLFAKTVGFLNVRKLQLVLHGYNRLECRVDFIRDKEALETFEKLKEILADSLEKFNVRNVNIYLSDEKPQIDSSTHKFKFAYQIVDQQELD